MRSIIFAFITVGMLGCATTSKTTSNRSAIAGSGASSKAIKDELTRTAENLGFYAVDAYVFTDALTDALEKERGEGDSDVDPAVTNLKIETARSSNKKTCFHFDLHTLGFGENDIRFWRMYLVLPHGEEHEIFIDPPSRFPKINRFARYRYNYSSEATGCAYKEITLEAGFRVVITPPEEWDRLEPRILTWKFD